MKFFVILFLLLITFLNGVAQEVSKTSSSNEFIIKRIEITPSLSTLAPENPYVGKFRIRTVNFDEKDTPIQVNLIEVMREVEYERANSYVDLAPPVQISEKKASISFSANSRETDARYFNHNFNPYLYSSGTKNTVYKDASETTRPIYYSRYSPFYRRY